CRYDSHGKMLQRDGLMSNNVALTKLFPPVDSFSGIKCHKSKSQVTIEAQPLWCTIKSGESNGGKHHVRTGKVPRQFECIFVAGQTCFGFSSGSRPAYDAVRSGQPPGLVAFPHRVHPARLWS